MGVLPIRSTINNLYVDAHVGAGGTAVPEPAALKIVTMMLAAVACDALCLRPRRA